MSDTPRTDAESEGWIGPVPDGVSVDFARQLERELAQTQDRYASALDDGLMKSTMYNKKCDELEQAQARSAELEKALRGVLSEADRDTDALIRAKFTTTVSPPIKYSKCPEPPMTNDELADEIEKRRGGSIEYLGKLLWSNSSRIIAALRRSITAYSHLTQEQFDQLVRDAMSWRTRPPSGEMVPEHAMLFSAAILVSDALHNEELQGAELKASTDTAWEKLSFAIEASRKALSAAEDEGRK